MNEQVYPAGRNAPHSKSMNKSPASKKTTSSRAALPSSIVSLPPAGIASRALITIQHGRLEFGRIHRRIPQASGSDTFDGDRLTDSSSYQLQNFLHDMAEVDNFGLQVVAPQEQQAAVDGEGISAATLVHMSIPLA